MYRYSKRLTWEVSDNEFATLVSGQRRSERTLLDLTRSNPTTCLSDYPHAIIQAAFAAIDRFDYDPQPFGIVAARSAVSSYYARRNLEVGIDRIVLTASTSEAYSSLFKLLCDAGDEVLVPSPSYPLFEYLAALENISLIPYQLQYDGAWHFDFDSLRSRITRRTRAIILVNPNNPTGTFLTKAERASLSDIAAEQHIPLICDEVFFDYAMDERASFCKTMIDCDSILSFSLNGLSKTAGMPQLKLAWIVVNGPLQDRAAALTRLELINDTYLSVATPVQKALPALLDAGESLQQTIRMQLMANLREIDASLVSSPAHRLHMDGGWSAILQIPSTQSEEQWITRLLLDHQVIVQPGYFFDMPPRAYLVISLLTPPADLREGLIAIKECLRAHT